MAEPLTPVGIAVQYANKYTDISKVARFLIRTSLMNGIIIAEKGGKGNPAPIYFIAAI